MASKPDGRAQAPFPFSDQLDPTTANMSSRNELVRRLHVEMAEETSASHRDSAVWYAHFANETLLPDPV
jgi:hypothetical protein